MILYCDTSALVKLYIAEPHSELVMAGVGRSEAVATSRIAWAEFQAAAARRAREVPSDSDAMDRAGDLLAADWGRYLVVEVSQTIVERAGDFAEAFALRGDDAVHLASAAEVQERTGHKLRFACFDKRLNKAAAILDMEVLHAG